MHEEKQNLDSIFREQTKNRVSVANTTHRERKKKLKTLLKTFVEMENEALSALYKDMKKNKTSIAFLKTKQKTGFLLPTQPTGKEKRS